MILSVYEGNLDPMILFISCSNDLWNGIKLIIIPNWKYFLKFTRRTLKDPFISTLCI